MTALGKFLPWPCHPAAHALLEAMSRFGFYFIFLFLLYKSPSFILAVCFAIYVYIHYRTRWSWIWFYFSDLCETSWEVGLHLVNNAMFSLRAVCRVFSEHVRSSSVLVSQHPQPAAMIFCSLVAVEFYPKTTTHMQTFKIQQRVKAP